MPGLATLHERRSDKWARHGDDVLVATIAEMDKRLAATPWFEWLDPPEPRGRVTLADALRARNPNEHHRLVRASTADVWAAWHPHHPTIRRWAERAFADRNHS